MSTQNYRDHTPITLEEFNGLWKRGDAESTPIDHFSDCNNLEYIQGGFRSRDGIYPYAAYPNITRIYTYNQPSQQSLLILDLSGNIYHTGSPTPLVPILSIPAMTDFAFVAINGRAYLSPHNGVTGLEGEEVYVYLGDGTPARVAGGVGPEIGSFAAATSATAGNVEAGVHIFAVVYETNTGFITNPGDTPVSLDVLVSDKKVSLTGIPVSVQPYIVARRIIATEAIDPTEFTGDLTGYEFFFVPDGRIEDNTTTTLDVNFYDQDLIDSADYLFDLKTDVSAGVNLGTYHNRLVVVAEYGEETGNPLTDTIGNISLARISDPGQPEAFNELTGFIVAPLDSKPLTNVQEYRDILYLFKQTKTIGYSDNGDVPSTWVPGTIIDEGTGAPIHGICNVLDSGGVNIDYVIMADWSGIMYFDGKFQRPELTWKIEDYWFAINRDEFNKIHMLNDSINKKLYVVLPNGTILMGNYSNGLNSQDIRWTPWTFDVNIKAIALVETNKLILASDGASS